MLNRSRTAKTLALSVAAHAIALVLLAGPDRATPPGARNLQIVIVDTPKSDPRRSEPQSKSKRIVQTESAKATERAAPDAFLGEKTQTVERQTTSSSQMTVAGKSARRKVARDRAEKSARSIERAARPAQTAATMPNRSLGLPERPLSKFGLPIQLGKRILEEPAGGREAQQDGGTDRKLAQEYVQGYRESDRTLLNTKEYVFFSYFQRIRERLDLAWQPILRDHIVKLYKSGRQLASEMDHRTRVVVTLDGVGAIVRVQLIEESGVSDLDTAAVEAFNRAGPFPNPPRGLIDTDGRVEIRWDFILKT